MSRFAVQPFPTGNAFRNNLNLTLSQLNERIGRAQGAARSYVMTSVDFKRNSDGMSLEQYGSGPNFQGGRLTLCTCKHQMRSSLDAEEWPHMWLAGFTSRSLHIKGHWLFFLTQIARSYESHFNLWRDLPAAVRDAKSAQEDYLGDLFAPRGKVAGEGRFDPRNYFAPPCHDHHKHSCDNGWHTDIRYNRFGRRPSLLVGDPKVTFMWNRPLICFYGHHCRDFKKWDSVKELRGQLRRKSS